MGIVQQNSKLQKILRACALNYDTKRHILCVSHQSDHLLITERNFSLNDFRIICKSCLKGGAEKITFGDADVICRSLYNLAANVVLNQQEICRSA